MKQVFSTKECKVKIVVYDFTGEDTPASHRRTVLTFSIAVMPLNLPSKTSFAAAGTVLAHTSDPEDALAELKKAAPSFSPAQLNSRIQAAFERGRELWKRHVK